MRLIDADTLEYKIKLLELANKVLKNDELETAIEFALMCLSEEIAHTIDYTPVVRCKDCQWWKTGGCWFHQPGKCGERDENDFCSDGQRRFDDAKRMD